MPGMGIRTHLLLPDSAHLHCPINLSQLTYSVGAFAVSQGRTQPSQLDPSLLRRGTVGSAFRLGPRARRACLAGTNFTIIVSTALVNASMLFRAAT